MDTAKSVAIAIAIMFVWEIGRQLFGRPDL